MSFVAALLCFHVCLLQTALGQTGWCGEIYHMSPFDYAPAAWAAPYGESLGPYGLAEPFGAYGLAEPFGAYGLAGPYGYGAYAEPYGDLATGPAGPYGGAGVGEVAVAGELPAGGATAVAGQVPILGAVEFGGPVRAAGTITIAGTCGCGCAGPYIY